MSNGFIQNAQMVGFFAQILYWIAMPILVAYAVVQYKRWVNFQLGTGHSGKLNPAFQDETASVKSAGEPAVSVEEFVE